MVRFFVSPYRRSYQTFEHIVEGAELQPHMYTFREEPRLREQDWGNFQVPHKVLPIPLISFLLNSNHSLY